MESLQAGLGRLKGSDEAGIQRVTKELEELEAVVGAYRAKYPLLVERFCRDLDTTLLDFLKSLEVPGNVWFPSVVIPMAAILGEIPAHLVTSSLRLKPKLARRNLLSMNQVF